LLAGDVAKRSLRRCARRPMRRACSRPSISAWMGRCSRRMRAQELPTEGRPRESLR
jgi:hypothetical protein